MVAVDSIAALGCIGEEFTLYRCRLSHGDIYLTCWRLLSSYSVSFFSKLARYGFRPQCISEDEICLIKTVTLLVIQIHKK